VFTATGFEANAQKHSCDSSTQRPTPKTGLARKSEELHTFLWEPQKVSAADIY